jgi:hypothetical protein
LKLSSFKTAFIVLLFAAMTALLWMYLQHANDVMLGRRVAGTWTHAGLLSITISPDGSFSESIGHSNALVSYQGVWRVKNSTFVMTVTNAEGTGSHQPGPVGSISRDKIIRADDHKFVWDRNGQPFELSR